MMVEIFFVSNSPSQRYSTLFNVKNVMSHAKPFNEAPLAICCKLKIPFKICVLPTPDMPTSNARLEKYIGSKRHSNSLSQKATFLIFISPSHQSSASISVHQPASAVKKSPQKPITASSPSILLYAEPTSRYVRTLT